MSTKQKLTAELKSDFQFSHDSRSNFLSYNKTATVSVSVGNLTKDVSIFMTSDGYGNDRKYSIKQNFERVFSEVYDIGFEIDFDHILEAYKVKRDTEVEIDKTRREVKYRQDYKNKWYHRLTDCKINNVEIKYLSEDEYVKKMLEGKSGGKPIISYNGITEEVDYTDVGVERTNYRYTLYGSITRNRRRSYKTPEKLVEKFVQLVDFKIMSDKASEIAKENKKIEEENTIKHLKKTFGDLVDKKDEWTKSYIRGHNYRTVVNYYLKVNGHENKIVIREDSTTNEKRYNYAGFHNLTAKQVNGILKALKS